MRGARGVRIILAMTIPVCAKLWIVPDPRHLGGEDRGEEVRLRRYRLARLRLPVRSDDPAQRFEHLARVYE
jgi:hypothetical protein